MTISEILILKLYFHLFKGCKRLQQIDRISPGRGVRRHPIPKHVERGLRGRRLETNPVQLGHAQLTQQSREGDSEVLSGKIRLG